MPSAIVRLLCESRSASRTVRDAATDQRPFYWRGSSVKFQLALTDGGAFLLKPAVGEIVVEVKALTALPSDECLMRKAFVAGDCDETFSAGNWGGGSKQLLEAAFTMNEAAILPGIYRLIVRHIDAGGEENVYLSSELQVLDPQSGSEGIDPPPIAWSYLNDVPVLRYTAQALSSPHKAQVFENLGMTFSSGGIPGDDFGKIAVFGETGWMKFGTYVHVVDAVTPAEGLFLMATRALVNSKGGFFSSLKWEAFDANRDLLFQNRAGLVAMMTDPLASEDRAGLMRDAAGKFHVIGWNPDQATYQGIGIRGAAGAETLFVYDLPA